MNYAISSKNIDIETKIGILQQYLTVLENKEEWKTRLPALFESLVEMHPEVADIHRFYALYLINIKELDKAQKEYATILDIDPKNEEAWEQIINLQIVQEKWDSVITLSGKAIEILPDNPQWYSYRASVYFKLDKKDEALTACQKGLALTKDNKKLKSEFYGQMADIMFDKKEKDSAFVYYDKALENNPLNAHVLNNYAYYLSLGKKDLLRAETMAKKCLEFDPRSSTVLDTYAWVLFQQGYYNLAKRYLQEAIKNGDKKDDVLFEHYGDVLYKTDSKDEAVKMWKKSQELGNKSEKLQLKIEKQEYVE
jgi:Tfp pilus assembly protein PilF